MGNKKGFAAQSSEGSSSWQTSVENKTILVSKSPETQAPGDFDETQLFDLRMLGQGDRIHVSEDDTLRYSGVVDTSAPSLGIIWIRQDGLGERKLIICTDYRLRQARTSHWDLKVFEREE
ncbi:hypothetical protein ACJJV6_08450 [Arthrobacter nitrophenolicus]|uniref:Uncharacterized protein n=1 Tax=Arthrobacter nitrophenolicus TaxID=683150 RepID=A0ACC6TH52_9MICC|nr:hypothetical protein [Arthrobacter nitrophenolicus]